MVRRKAEIELIKDDAKRHTTFTRRRKGLEKKMRDLCRLCDVEGVVITFSKSGNAFACGDPTVNFVINRYLELQGDVNNGGKERACGDAVGIADEVGAPPLTEVEKIISEAMENGRAAWEAAVRNLGLSELGELEAAVEKIKSKVAARAREVAESGMQRDIRESILKG